MAKDQEAQQQDDNAEPPADPEKGGRDVDGAIDYRDCSQPTNLGADSANMPRPMMATRTPPITRPLKASSIPPTTMASSIKPVTNVPVEMVWAAVPRLENGSWAKHAVPT